MMMTHRALLLVALWAAMPSVSGTGTFGRQAMTVTGAAAADLGLRGPSKFAPAGTKVASLTVEAASGQAASLVLLSKDKPAYSMQADKSGTFSIRQGESDIITISETGDLVARTHMLAAGALSAATGVYVHDVMQWALVVDEQFNGGQEGWTIANSGGAKVPTSQCRGGLYMLGGFEALANEAVQKTFKNLPQHTKVRVTATLHFIDDWNGETAYMKMRPTEKAEMDYMWTERYDVSDYRDMIDVCGGALGEGRFSTPIDVSMAHTGDSLSLQFGTTHNLPAAASKGFFGISSVQIYIRA